MVRLPISSVKAHALSQLQAVTMPLPHSRISSSSNGDPIGTQKKRKRKRKKKSSLLSSSL